MNTIHSSSLAFYPAGQIKPERDSLNKKPALQGPLEEQNRTNQDLTPPASTPNEIEKALAKVGLNNPSGFSEESNPRTYRALQAYNQTRDQSIQSQLENVIFGVDYYV